MKQKERQLDGKQCRTHESDKPDKQFTYDVEPPEGLAKGVEEGV